MKVLVIGILESVPLLYGSHIVKLRHEYVNLDEI